MVGEPVGASLALIAIMLGAWFGVIGVGAYLAWRSIRGVRTSSIPERANLSDESFGEEVA